MTARAAGRHRATNNWAPPASLLLVDYLESGRFTGHRIGTARPRIGTTRPRFGAPPPGATVLPADTTVPPADATAPLDSATTLLDSAWFTVPSADAPSRASVIRPFFNWRMLGLAASALLVGVAAALFFGGHAGHRSPAAIPSAPAPTPPTPPASVLPPSGTPTGPATPKPAPHPKHHTAPPPPSRQPAPGTAPVAQPAGTSPHIPQATPLVVRYLVASQGPGGFQGEIEVTNNGTRPISGWQIAVALPDDQVLSFSNASGFVSNGILLLQPGPGAQPIPPGGGQLNVFFVAEGAQTIPQACAFNDVLCG